MAALTLSKPDIGTPASALKKIEAARVSDSIAQICAQLGPGGRVPSHTELMRQLNASERIVLKSLDEMVRQGRIVRRQGSGTYVADRATTVAPRASATVNRSIVAIARPDKSIFDRCMELLYHKSIESGVAVNCHLLGPDQIDTITPEALGDPMGFMVFRRDLAPLARRLQDAGKRVVLVGAPGPDQVFGVPCVCGNQELGGYLVVKRLIELGHRRIVFSHECNSLQTQSRWNGNAKALNEAARVGRVVHPEFVSHVEVHKWMSSPDSARDYFGRPDAPTVVAAWNDREAIDILNALSRAGIDVPGRVSVIGYDNLEEGARMHPALSTVDHLIEQQVDAAVDILTSEREPDANRTIVFAPTIVERETLSAVAAS